MASNLRAWFRGWKLRPEWTVATAVFCLFWLVSRRYAGPAYLSDEVGYLGHAALLARYTIDGASSWHAGYSLLLAPLFRIFTEPAHIWQGVIVLNAAMWATSFLMLLHLVARFFPGQSTLRRMSAVAVALLYPTWLTMSGYAFATTAIVFVFMVSVTVALGADLRRRWSLVPHSLVVGLLYWVHPTGLAVVLASTLALAVFSFRKRQFVSLAVHIVLAGILIGVYQEGLHQWLLDAGTSPGFAPNEHYQSFVSVLPHFAKPGFWCKAAVASLGQLSYLAVGSFGLGVFGFVHLVRLSREHLQARSFEDIRGEGVVGYISLLILLSIVGVICMGSASFSASDLTPRVDHWIYGRYAEGVLLPFLAIGFLASCRRRWLPLVAGGLLVSGVLLSVTATGGGYNNLVNTTSFWPQYLMETPNYLLWMVVGALGVVVYQVARQMGKAWKSAALVLLLAAYVLSDTGAAQFHQGILDSYSKPTAFVETVRTNIEPGSCVGFSPEMPADADLFHQERYQLYLFHLYDYAYQRMYIADWLSGCDGPLFTYAIDQLRNVPGVVLLGQETRSGLYLVAKDRDQGFQIPYEAPTERTFYPAEDWTIRSDLYRYGEQLAKLPSRVGAYHDGSWASTGRPGPLVFGPYVAMGAGEYRLVVRGASTSISSAYVDVTSTAGRVQHAKLPLSLSGGDESGILASGHVSLDEDVLDLEVRVYVEVGDDVRLDGYELVPDEVA